MTLAVNYPQRVTIGQHMLLAFFVIPLLVLLSACTRPEPPLQLAGATMGTSYHITVSAQTTVAVPADLRADIEQVLEDISRSMSTYREDAEIVRFNRAEVGAWLTVSRPFMDVFLAARAVTRASEGAYDVSVAPLVDLWGFGPEMGDTVPTQATIQRLLLTVGEQQVEVDEQATRMRKLGPVQLDFSSIAKGYAVDQVVQLLQARSLTDFMVEIGGEVRVSGLSPRDQPWRIAIERPVLGGGAPLVVLAVSDVGIATSGSYRNYFEVDGVRYSHTLDPRSGWPVQHELVSVTVLHPQVTVADAWATALTVLGPERALAIAQQQNLAAYLVLVSGDELVVRKTSAIEAYLQ